MSLMKKFTSKVTTCFLIVIFIASSFLFFEILIVPQVSYSPIPLQNNAYIEDIIMIPEKTSNSDLIQQKISKRFQDLLKTQDSTQHVSCFILLNDQPTGRIARQMRESMAYSDKVALRKAIYQETKNMVLPTQNALIPTISSLNGTILQQYVVINALFVDIPLQTLPALAELPQIARIEPNYQLQATLDVSHPIVLNITAPGWDYSYNGTGIVVAVCDTGIDKTHPALVGKVIDEKSFAASEPFTDDADGHGTHVAGIIASANTTYMGIASNVSLVNVKIMAAGSGDTSQLISGIEWLLTNTSRGADVINLSAGTTTVVADGDSTIAKFIDAIVSSYDVVWVNAAGNTPSTIEVPGDAMNCISVANFDDNNNLDPSSWVISGSSSQGPTEDGRKKPDLAAPGTNILSCNNDWEGGSDFVSNSGTSMAAPHVAGAAALIIQYLETNYGSLDSSWHALLTKGILLHSAKDLGSSGYDYAFGHGALDMGAVWNFFQTGDFAVQTLEPSHSICKYRIDLNTSRYLNITAVWNRVASTDYEYIYYQDLKNIDLRLEDTNENTVASATSTVDNVEQIFYNASSGSYYLFVDATDLKHNDEDQRFVVLANAPITFIELIHTWTIIEIIIVISVTGIIIVVLAYILFWLRDRRKRSKEQPVPQPPSEISTWPEWPQQTRV